MSQTIETSPQPSDIHPSLKSLLSGQSLSPESNFKHLQQTLKTASAQGGGLYHSPIQTAARSGPHRLDRYIHIGPESEHEPLKLAVFSAVRGSDTWSPFAVASFLLDLEQDSRLSTGVHLYVYPVVDIQGYTSEKPESSNDLYLELWQNSEDALAYLIERELSVIPFHGVVVLLGQNHLSGVSGQIHGAGATLHESLLQPALRAAAQWGPQADKEDWGAKQRLSLTAGGHLKPKPFEVLLKIPSRWEASDQIGAGRVALHSVLSSYRGHISQAHHI